MKAIVALGFVGVGLLVVLAFLYSRLDAEPAGVDQGAYRGSEPPARIVMPGFALQDYEGREVTSDGLLGGVVLLTFLDAQCQETCPVVAPQIAQTFGRMDPDLRARVTAVAISTDPEEDTSAAVQVSCRWGLTFVTQTPERRPEETCGICSDFPVRSDWPGS